MIRAMTSLPSKARFVELRLRKQMIVLRRREPAAVVSTAAMGLQVQMLDERAGFLFLFGRNSDTAYLRLGENASRR